MSLAAWAVLCAAVAGFAAPAGGPHAGAARLRDLLEKAPARPRRRRTGNSGLARCAAAGLAGVSLTLIVGGPGGAAAGVVAGYLLARFLARLEPARDRARRRRVAADLPVAADLLAACLSAGTPWVDAVEAVGAALGGPLGAELSGIAAQARLGADPVELWLSLDGEPVLRPLARAFARTVHSGAPLTGALTRLAADERRRERSAAMARARAAGVRAVAPLGLCFLPAFVLLGIVPAVAGIAAAVTLP